MVAIWILSGEFEMRLLFINEFVYFSGGERLVSGVIKGLEKRGHVIKLLTADNFDWSPGNFLNAVKNFQPDLIHVFNFANIGMQAFDARDFIPYVLTVVDYWIICKCRHRINFTTEELCTETNWDNCGKCPNPNILMKLPDQVMSKKFFENIPLTTISERTAQILRKFGYNPEVIHACIEMKQIGEDRNYVLCVAKGELIWKGAKYFSEIAKGLDKYTFILAGSRLNFPNVSNVGYLSDDMLESLYRNCSVFIMPSIWEEPTGYTHLEAMRYGKPCIAFDIGAMPEYIKRVIVPYKDVEKAREVLVEMMENPDLRKERGLENYENLKKNFTVDIMAEKYENFYKKVLGIK